MRIIWKAGGESNQPCELQAHHSVDVSLKLISHMIANCLQSQLGAGQSVDQSHYFYVEINEQQKKEQANLHYLEWIQDTTHKGREVSKHYKSMDWIQTQRQRQWDRAGTT